MVQIVSLARPLWYKLKVPISSFVRAKGGAKTIQFLEEHNSESNSNVPRTMLVGHVAMRTTLAGLALFALLSACESLRSIRCFCCVFRSVFCNFPGRHESLRRRGRVVCSVVSCVLLRNGDRTAHRLARMGSYITHTLHDDFLLPENFFLRSLMSPRVR